MSSFFNFLNTLHTLASGYPKSKISIFSRFYNNVEVINFPEFSIHLIFISWYSVLKHANMYIFLNVCEQIDWSHIQSLLIWWECWKSKVNILCIILFEELVDITRLACHCRCLVIPLIVLPVQIVNDQKLLFKSKRINKVDKNSLLTNDDDVVDNDMYYMQLMQVSIDALHSKHLFVLSGFSQNI